MADKKLRCAIYTRKSSEEGLEQDFNSLHAQREACEAYIVSQKHEGWTVIPTLYDDGGYSGGSLERPALNALLTDIAANKIDVVVVYKVDRLTRSLADFAKIVEIFDANTTSFVSVTQAFNTTSSMGRLTLNVLLSFAQFEREVTGERIRDKIAASKAKGMWMGGHVPMGYRREDRRLVIAPNEASLVRTIFARYLELGTVEAVERSLKQDGIVTPTYRSAAGNLSGSRPFHRGHLYQCWAMSSMPARSSIVVLFTKACTMQSSIRAHGMLCKRNSLKTLGVHAVRRVPGIAAFWQDFSAIHAVGGWELLIPTRTASATDTTGRCFDPMRPNRPGCASRPRRWNRRLQIF